MAFRISWRIILIITSAAAIAFSTYSYLNSLQQTVKIIVAAEDIPAHTEITESMLKEIEVEINSAQSLVKRSSNDKNQLVKGITLKKITAGEPIQLDPETLIFPENRQMYLRANGEVDVTYFIPKDRRLLTVALDPQGSVNNSLRKGDWVDVIYSTKDDNKAASAKMFLQQIEVFETETIKFNEDATGKQGIVQHVTLLVTPQEAVVLSLAKRQGNIDLTLNPWNGEKEKVIPVNQDVLR